MSGAAHRQLSALLLLQIQQQLERGLHTTAGAAEGFDLLRLLRWRRSRADAPLRPGRVSPGLPVPPHIPRPDYITNGAAGGVTAKGAPPIAKEPEIHGEEGAARMRAAGALAAAALRAAAALVSPGVTTESLDAAAHAAIVTGGGYPSPLGYGGFPKSVCTSVNECICHGIPDDRPLQDGDIVNIDVTAFLGGHHGDTNATFYVGEPRPHTRDLVETTREALAAAINVCGPGVPFSAIGDRIQAIADRARLSVVRELVGHGIGRVFHAAPSVLHHRNTRPGVMQLGQTFTIEPILTLGSRHHRPWTDGWTLVTVDASLAAQFEHTLLVTPDGVEVLTQQPAAAMAAEGAAMGAARGKAAGAVGSGSSG